MKTYCPVGYLYHLVNPETKEIRYVGQTQNRKRRYKQHVEEAYNPKNNHKINWIKNLDSKGLIPEMQVYKCVDLDILGDEETLDIILHRSLGYNLTNSATGFSVKNHAKVRYSDYIGVSFNKNQDCFITFVEVAGFNFIGGFKDEEAAKLWHDRVAKYYGLPINEEPDYTCSLEDVKLLIKKDRSSKRDGLGVIGVVKVGETGYSASIMISREKIYIGCFPTLEEATYYADATRNYYGLTNNRTTTDKLSVEEAKLKIAKARPPKGIRFTGKSWTVRFTLNQKEYNVGKIKTLEQAIYISDALRNNYGLPNSQTTQDKLTLEEAKELV
jgi:hypothetical protein